MNVCIAGGGTIGSLLAAHLGRVTDVSVLVRRADHARALNSLGLRVSGRADFTARVTAATDPADLPSPELVIIACKGSDLEAVADRLRGEFDGATVMTIQNGLGAEEIVAARGGWPLLSSVTFMSGTRHDDAHVEYILDTATWVGPYRGTTPADARAVAELIVTSGLKAEAFDDLRPAQWSKLIFNATVNGVAGLTGLAHDYRFAEEPLGPLVHALVEEGKAAAAAAGVELWEDPWEMNLLATQRGFRHSPSMLEDVRAQRATEVELINGSLVREAERFGVDVPLHRTVYALVRGKEASYT
ncbi:MAG TPA: ketopantoate reductase family protein [Gaiellaceae bacterium]